MKIIKGVEQGTHEWMALRRGRVTGTKLQEVMGSPLERLKLMSELIAEEGTEQTKAFRPTAEMERGSAEEVFAIKAYEERYGKKVEKVTMIISDEFPWFGVSPDGLICSYGIIKDKKTKLYTEAIEIKNPNSSTMIMYKMGNLVPDCSLGKKHWLGIPLDYKWQVVGSFLVNPDLERLHFVVHDARFIDEDHKIYVVTVERDHPQLQEALTEARAALVSFREEWIKVRDIVLPASF